MADNFLEKHYDDYEVRKATWEKRKQLIKIHKQLSKPNQVDNNNQSTSKQGISTNSASGK